MVVVEGSEGVEGVTLRMRLGLVWTGPVTVRLLGGGSMTINPSDMHTNPSSHLPLRDMEGDSKRHLDFNENFLFQIILFMGWIVRMGRDWRRDV